MAQPTVKDVVAFVNSKFPKSVSSREIARHFGCSTEMINRRRDGYPGIYSISEIMRESPSGSGAFRHISRVRNEEPEDGLYGLPPPRGPVITPIKSLQKLKVRLISSDRVCKICSETFDSNHITHPHGNIMCNMCAARIDQGVFIIQSNDDQNNRESKNMLTATGVEIMPSV